MMPLCCSHTLQFRLKEGERRKGERTGSGRKKEEENWEFNRSKRDREGAFAGDDNDDDDDDMTMMRMLACFLFFWAGF